VLYCSTCEVVQEKKIHGPLKVRGFSTLKKGAK